MVIYTNLEKLVTSLAEAIELHDADPDNEVIRDALVKRFEMAYEMSYKMLARYLEENMTKGEYDSIDGIAGLIRAGAESGLLANSWEEWETYRDMRNGTIHQYDEEMIMKFMSGIRGFLDEIRYFLQQLKKRSGE